MTLSQQLDQLIDEQHLLKHPFYQAWMAGELSLSTLQKYAEQYHHHIEAFPRYISRTHSMCSSLPARKQLLENLNDEEGGGGHTDHPELWLRFCEGLGVSRETVLASQPCESIQKLMKTFFDNASSSYEEGLAAFYTYESMVPEVAKSKIEGLKENYQIDDESTLSFFEVHREADVHHRQSCARAINQIPSESHDKAKAATGQALQALWNFLDEMHLEEKTHRERLAEKSQRKELGGEACLH